MLFLQETPVGPKTLLMNRNRFKKELNGAKLITEKSQLWADYNTLPSDRSYRMNAVKFYYKKTEIVRLEIEYLMAAGDIVNSIQPEDSDSVRDEKDVQCVEVKLSRTENIASIEG